MIRSQTILARYRQPIAQTLSQHLFNMVLASSGDLANLVATQQVNCAFGVDYERLDDPRITYQPLGKIRLMSVCNSQHPLVKQNELEMRNCVNLYKPSWSILMKK